MVKIYNVVSDQTLHWTLRKEESKQQAVGTFGMKRVGVVSVMAQKDEAIKLYHNNRWINTRPGKSKKL